MVNESKPLTLRERDVAFAVITSGTAAPEIMHSYLLGSTVEQNGQVVAIDRHGLVRMHPETALPMTLDDLLAELRDNPATRRVLFDETPKWRR